MIRITDIEFIIELQSMFNSNVGSIAPPPHQSAQPIESNRKALES